MDLDSMQSLLDQLENAHKQLEMKGPSMTKTTDILIETEVNTLGSSPNAFTKPIVPPNQPVLILKFSWSMVTTRYGLRLNVDFG